MMLTSPPLSPGRMLPSVVISGYTHERGYTEYMVEAVVYGKQWCSRHRFSDFRALHEDLALPDPFPCPKLPFPAPEKRKTELEAYLVSLLNLFENTPLLPPQLSTFFHVDYTALPIESWSSGSALERELSAAARLEREVALAKQERELKSAHESAQAEAVAAAVAAAMVEAEADKVRCIEIWKQGAFEAAGKDVEAALAEAHEERDAALAAAAADKAAALRAAEADKAAALESLRDELSEALEEQARDIQAKAAVERADLLAGHLGQVTLASTELRAAAAEARVVELMKESSALRQQLVALTSALGLDMQDLLPPGSSSDGTARSAAG